MAGSDYYSCDVCGGKTIYDGDMYPRWADAGSVKIICLECAKTHEIVVRDVYFHIDTLKNKR